MEHATNTGGLSGIFNKAKMAGHYLMYFTMGAMALSAFGGLWASGVPVGVFDPIGMFLASHFPTWDTLSQIGTGVDAIFNAAVHGNWVSDAFWTNPHSLMTHAGHAGHAAVEATAPALSETAKQVLGM